MILQRKSLGGLFERLIAGGRRIIAPVRRDGLTGFEEVTSADAVALDYVQTTSPANQIVRHAAGLGALAAIG